MTVNAQELYFILDHTPAKQNIMLVGRHGIGKSRILEDYYSAKNQKVVTLFLGQMSDPGDLIGLPEKNAQTGKTDFMLPYWFPTDGKPVVLFLDELNRARPEVLQTIMDLTLNRKLAGKQLPEGSRIISAVNSGNEYQLTDLDPALVSRFNIYEFAPTVEDWLLWGASSGIDPRILAFIKDNPEYLDSGFEGDTENLERTVDRRSWERCSQIIGGTEELTQNYKVLLSGILGNSAVAAFFDYLEKAAAVSPRTILTEGGGESLTKLLKNNELTAFIKLNESLFNFLEFCAEKDPQKNLFAENLTSYFDFLCQNQLSEVQSHFASLCKASQYPVTLNFIAQNAQELYKKLLQFIAE